MPPRYLESGHPPECRCGRCEAAATARIGHIWAKPANILLANPKDGEQRIFLGDFGIARNAGDISGLTATNMIVGTLPYAAPEQLMDDPIDGRADGAFRRKPTDALERYYPVPAPEVFKALNEVVPRRRDVSSKAMLRSTPRYPRRIRAPTASMARSGRARHSVPTAL